MRDLAFSFLLPELSKGEGVMPGVHLLGLELRLPPVKVGNLLLKHPTLVFDALLVVRHVLLHVVEPRVQLKRKTNFVLWFLLKTAQNLP